MVPGMKLDFNASFWYFDDKNIGFNVQKLAAKWIFLTLIHGNVSFTCYLIKNIDIFSLKIVDFLKIPSLVLRLDYCQLMILVDLLELR
jgi:hypothetical protein